MGGNLQRAGDWKSPLAGLKLWKEACTPENGSKEQSAIRTEHPGASIIKKNVLLQSPKDQEQQQGQLFLPMILGYPLLA